MPILAGATHYDDFNRADAGNLGTSSSGHAWSHPVGNFQVGSNKAFSPTPGGNHIAVLDVGASDGVVQCDRPDLTLGISSGLIVRYVDLSNYIYLNNQGQVIKRKAGVNSVLATTAAATNGDTWTIVFTGSSYEVYLTRAGSTTLQASFTETDHQTATKHGMRQVFGEVVTTLNYDDWSFAASLTPPVLSTWSAQYIGVIG